MTSFATKYPRPVRSILVSNSSHNASKNLSFSNGSHSAFKNLSFNSSSVAATSVQANHSVVSSSNLTHSGYLGSLHESDPDITAESQDDTTSGWR